MATSKALTGGTLDVNPQWWNLGTIPCVTPARGDSPLWFFEGDIHGCYGSHWQTPQNPIPNGAPIYPSGYVDCINASGMFPKAPYNLPFFKGEEAFDIPILDIHRCNCYDHSQHWYRKCLQRTD